MKRIDNYRVILNADDEEPGLPSPSMEYHKEGGDRIELSFTSEKPLDLLPLHAYLSELADSLQAKLICSVYEPILTADENNDAENAV